MNSGNPIFDIGDLVIIPNHYLNKQKNKPEKGIVINVWFGNKNELKEPGGYYIYIVSHLNSQNIFGLRKLRL